MYKRYDALKLENQICFPLYACSKEIVKAYKPYLDELDLTYTQYITMMGAKVIFCIVRMMGLRLSKVINTVAVAEGR